MSARSVQLTTGWSRGRPVGIADQVYDIAPESTRRQVLYLGAILRDGNALHTNRMNSAEIRIIGTFKSPCL